MGLTAKLNYKILKLESSSESVYINKNNAQIQYLDS